MVPPRKRGLPFWPEATRCPRTIVAGTDGAIRLIAPSADFASGSLGLARCFATAILVQDGGGGARSTACSAEISDFDEAIEIAHATGGLHLDFAAAGGAHQCQVVLSGAFVVVAAIWL